jgi:hypothetical protein
MVYEINKTHEICKIAKNELEYMNIVTKNKDRMITNISEMREESEEKVSGFEKELNAQSNVMIDLKEKLRRKMSKQRLKS